MAERLRHGTSAGRSSPDVAGTSLLRSRTIETWGLTGTVLEVRRNSRWLGRQSFAGERLRVPVLVLTRALLLRVVGRVATVAAGVLRAGERLLQVGELLSDGTDAVTLDVDDAVPVAFFAVFVDETAGEDARHVWLVEGLGFGEGAGVGDAAVFGEAGSLSACIEDLNIVATYKRGKL